jgi:hypothetical protein
MLTVVFFIKLFTLPARLTTPSCPLTRGHNNIGKIIYELDLSKIVLFPYNVNGKIGIRQCPTSEKYDKKNKYYLHYIIFSLYYHTLFICHELTKYG